MALFRVPSWETFADGAEAAEEIARAHGVPLEKAVIRILTGQGYDVAVRALLRALQKAARGPEQKAVAEAVATLDRDWEKLPGAVRSEVIRGASAKILQLPSVIVSKVQPAIERNMREIVTLSKRDTGKQFRINVKADFDKRDDRIVKFAAESQGSYITDRYRERARTFEAKAREIVADGLSKGLGRTDIGANLREALGPKAALRNSEAYWETVASVHTTRARSWGQLVAYSDAEIDEFEWESVLDEVTTEQCRFMQGRRFSVAKAVERFEQVEESGDDDAVKKLQPWVRMGKTKDGGAALFAEKPGGGRALIAHVESSGVGVSDKIGQYRSAISDAGLTKLGIMTPPIHGRCRSTIVPV